MSNKVNWIINFACSFYTHKVLNSLRGSAVELAKINIQRNCQLLKHVLNHDYCYVEMPNEDNKILRYNDGKNSLKVPFIIYADLESLLNKMSTCHNNPEKVWTTKINEHTPSGYSLFQCSLDLTKSNLGYYKRKDCMKKFCEDMKEYATEIINMK